MIGGKEKKINKMCKACKVKLTSEEKQLKGKKLLKVVMQKWINASEAILEMIIIHLPSPRVA
jgi:elongation factor 2